MNNKLNNIFSETDCLSSDVLLAYSENRLSQEEMHLVEKHLLDCQLCSDALEGISLIKNKSKFKPAVEDILKKIDSKSKPKVVYFNFRMRMAAAAIIIVLVGLTFVIRYFLVNQEKDKMVALRNENEAKEEKIIGGENENQEKSLEKSLVQKQNNYKKADSVAVIINQHLEKKSEPVEDVNNNISESVVINSTEQSAVQAPSYADYYKADETKNANDALAEKEVAVSSPTTVSNSNINTVTDKSEARNAEVPYANNKVTAYQSYEIKDVKTKSEGSKKSKEDKNKNNVAAGAAQTETDTVAVSQDNRYLSGIQLYRDADYDGCKQQMESYVKDIPGDLNAYYYIGVSEYNLAKYDSAITNLSKVVKDKKSEYFETAQWYLALCYLEKKNNSEAEKILKDIIKAKGNFKKQAEEKLKEIKN
ncbi:MAG TPA: tetratricopeptide repeat protein [Bacteroidales bacterium]|nr:tetratricopeptide repeat protein [Bacteroidales bacterium]HPS17035.1 tetratricopeptide repeat protein [Bacteroidales bacterium]